MVRPILMTWSARARSGSTRLFAVSAAAKVADWGVVNGSSLRRSSRRAGLIMCEHCLSRPHGGTKNQASYDSQPGGMDLRDRPHRQLQPSNRFEQRQ